MLRPKMTSDTGQTYYQVQSVSDFYEIIDKETSARINYVKFIVPYLGKNFNIIKTETEIGAIARNAIGVAKIISCRKRNPKEVERFNRKLEEAFNVLTFIDRGLLFFEKIDPTF